MVLPKTTLLVLQRNVSAPSLSGATYLSPWRSTFSRLRDHVSFPCAQVAAIRYVVLRSTDSGNFGSIFDSLLSCELEEPWHHGKAGAAEDASNLRDATNAP